MKKNILNVLLIFILLFTITGCKTKEIERKDKTPNSRDEVYVTIDNEKFRLSSKRSLHNIHYKENYVDFHTDAIGNIRLMNYVKGDKFYFEVRVICEEEKSLKEVKEAIIKNNPITEGERIVNGRKYIYCDGKVDGKIIHDYIYEYKDKVYSIMFLLGDNSGNIEEIFMNNVTFD